MDFAGKKCLAWSARDSASVVLVERYWFWRSILRLAFRWRFETIRNYQKIVTAKVQSNQQSLFCQDKKTIIKFCWIKDLLHMLGFPYLCNLHLSRLSHICKTDIYSYTLNTCDSKQPAAKQQLKILPQFRACSIFLLHSNTSWYCARIQAQLLSFKNKRHSNFEWMEMVSFNVKG